MATDNIRWLLDLIQETNVSDDPVVEVVETPKPMAHSLIDIMRELREEGIVETVSTGQGGGSAGNGGGAMVGGPTTYEQEYGMFKSKGPRRITAMTNEALDSSYPYEYKNNAYYFTTDNGEEYKVGIQGNKKVEVHFEAKGQFGQAKDHITGAGDSRKVFGTVVNIVKDYVSQYNPEVIMFAAVNSEPSRVRLYNMLAKQAANALPGYTLVKTLKDALLTKWYLTRDNIKVPKMDTVKHYAGRALDTIVGEDVDNTITLTQLYKQEKPDDNEQIWDYGTMIWDTPYEINKITPRELDWQLCHQYGVEDVEDLFERMNEEQHEVIDNYMKDPNLSNYIIVTDNGHIVDGNHRAVAAVLTRKPLRYIDIGDEEDL